MSQQNHPPVIISKPITEALPDSVYIYQARAEDPDGDELSWQLLGSPAGIVMDRRSGLIYGEIISPGDHLIRLAVMDGLGAKVEQSFTVVVVPKPVITSIPPRYAFTGSMFRYQLHAYDPEQLDLSYTLSGGPAGMGFNTNSGLLTWEDPEPGESVMELTVTNSLGYSTNQTFSLSVIHEQGLAIVSRPETQAYVSEVYEYQIAILGLQESGFSYSLVHGPPGMDLNETTGRITWEPQTAGHHHVEVRVTNETGNQDTQSFDIEVTTLETMDMMFNRQIDTLFEAVSLGHFQEASRLLTPQGEMRLIPALQSLQPFVSTVKDNFNPAVRMMISGNIAEYLISGTQAGRQRSFIVTFFRNSSGDWNIHSL